MAKTATARKAPSKSEVYGTIAEKTELSRKQVKEVFDALADMISKNLKKSGPQQFTVPGLAKIVVKRKPAPTARIDLISNTKNTKAKRPRSKDHI